MLCAPQLTARQWRSISALLPETKRDRLMISSLLFRQTTGLGLRDVARWFGVTRTRLSEWEQALTADDTLERVMQTLRLERAGPLLWSGGGRQSNRHFQSKEMADAVLELRFRKFRDALAPGRSDDKRDDLEKLAELHGWGR